MTAIEHAEYLAGLIGPRPSGSPANAQAAAYIASQFTAAGLAVEEQPYAVPAWLELSSRLLLDGRPLACVANPFSPPADVAGPAMPLGTLAQLEAADLTGRVVVLYGELAQAPLAAKAWPYKSEAEARLVELLEARPPLALVAIQPRPGELERLVEDWELDIPSLTVPAAAGLELLAALPASLSVAIESQRRPGTAANVVGRTAGGPGRDRIAIMAHFDTKFDTPGATDNAGGVATLLALAEHFGRRPPPAMLEFIAFNNEEYLPVGDDEYLARSQSYFGDIVTAINFDGVGAALGANTITAIAERPEFGQRVRAISAAFPAVAWVAPWPESNHSTFAWRGVPSVALSNSAVSHLAHLRTDTIAWLSPARLDEAVALGRALVGQLTIDD
jgi:Iap family predicted aminopeptidase